MGLVTSSVRESYLAERLFCPRRNVLSEAFAESREEGYRQDEADALVGRRLQKRAGTQQYQEGKQGEACETFFDPTTHKGWQDRDKNCPKPPSED